MVWVNLGPPRFPMWQFRSPTGKRGDEGGTVEIYSIDDVSFLRILGAWHVSTKNSE